MRGFGGRLLRQPRLAEAFERGRKIRRVLLQPFDGDYGIEVPGFGEGRFRIVHSACMRVGGRKVRVGEKRPSPRVDRLPKFVDRRVEMAEADLRLAKVDVKNADLRVARA